jgi:hypothetical protein
LCSEGRREPLPLRAVFRVHDDELFSSGHEGATGLVGTHVLLPCHEIGHIELGFKPEVDKASIGFDAIDEMARQFEASNTATASRFAAVGPIPCAFIISEQGKLKYASRSTSMRDGNAWIQPGLDLPRESFSAKARTRSPMAQCLKLIALLSQLH